MWRAAERCPRFDVALIEQEVRPPYTAGRIARRVYIDGWVYDRDSLYAWTPTSSRVYALRGEAEGWIVVTTMAPGMDTRPKLDDQPVRGVASPPHSDN
jgi:hypothetical protein